MTALTTLSDDLSGAVDAAARSVVAIRGGRRMGASGVLWRPGVVVTTDHALESDDDLQVVLPDGARLDAAVAGRDPSTDVAVLQLKGCDLAPIEKASADTIAVGRVVLAIARPGSDGPAASMGVISAVSGPWNTWRGGRVDRFIRADVSVYPGFSGGPLVDTSGSALGVNTSGLTRHWSVTLPVTTVDRVVDALLARGRIARGYIGVGLQSVRIPDAIASALRLSRGGGAIVVAVEPGSPADKGGMLIGDVLVGLGDGVVADVEDLQALLGPDTVGTRVVLRIIRAGALAEVGLTVGERPDERE